MTSSGRSHVFRLSVHVYICWSVSDTFILVNTWNVFRFCTKAHLESKMKNFNVKVYFTKKCLPCEHVILRKPREKLFNFVSNVHLDSEMTRSHSLFLISCYCHNENPRKHVSFQKGVTSLLQKNWQLSSGMWPAVVIGEVLTSGGWTAVQQENSDYTRTIHEGLMCYSMSLYHMRGKSSSSLLKNWRIT